MPVSVHSSSELLVPVMCTEQDRRRDAFDGLSEKATVLRIRDRRRHQTAELSQLGCPTMYVDTNKSVAVVQRVSAGT
jgi:hypothetical protein